VAVAGRRAFCAQVCRAGLGAALISGRAAAQSELPTVRGEVTDRAVRVPLAGTALAAAGGYARVVSTAGSFLVTRFSEREFQVFSAICSHESCLISEGDAETFVCPCHGSTFDHRGAVLVGPAELPLYACAATVSDGVLTITVA
jgi:Rieske Fe-S protein